MTAPGQRAAASRRQRRRPVQSVQELVIGERRRHLEPAPSDAGGRREGAAVSAKTITAPERMPGTIWGSTTRPRLKAARHRANRRRSRPGDRAAPGRRHGQDHQGHQYINEDGDHAHSVNMKGRGSLRDAAPAAPGSRGPSSQRGAQPSARHDEISSGPITTSRNRPRQGAFMRLRKGLRHSYQHRDDGNCERDAENAQENAVEIAVLRQPRQFFSVISSIIPLYWPQS